MRRPKYPYYCYTLDLLKIDIKEVTGVKIYLNNGSNVIIELEDQLT